MTVATLCGQYTRLSLRPRGSPELRFSLPRRALPLQHPPPPPPPASQVHHVTLRVAFPPSLSTPVSSFQLWHPAQGLTPVYCSINACWLTESSPVLQPPGLEMWVAHDSASATPFRASVPLGSAGVLPAILTHHLPHLVLQPRPWQPFFMSSLACWQTQEDH